MRTWANVRGRELYVHDKEGLKNALIAAVEKQCGMTYCIDPDLENVFIYYYGLDCEPIEEDGSWYVFGECEPFDAKDFEILAPYVHGYIEFDYEDFDWDCRGKDILRLVYEYGEMTVKYAKLEWGRRESAYWIKKLKAYMWQDELAYGESHVKEFLERAGFTNEDYDDLNLPEYTHFE